jgi:hypothetical protein
VGCDSIVTLNFTRLTTSGTDIISSCNPITWIDGNTYSTSNSTATHALTNAAGCDSVVTLNYTRLLATSGTSVISSCNPITWINGVTYSSSNSVATHTLTNAAGCDSIVTLNFTRLLATSSTQTINECAGFSITVGSNTYNSSGVYTDVLTNSLGCDSTVTTNLTIAAPINVSVTNNTTSLFANQSGATYQWIDCNNGNALISGATNQVFSPLANGSYAVIVTLGSCSDTSACATVSTIGIAENTTNALIGLYPNPNNGQFTIELAENSMVEITDVLGKEVFQSNLQEGGNQLNLSHIETGVYFVTIITGGKQVSVKIVKE